MTASAFDGEYRALRGGAGSVVLARDVLAVRGPDAFDYLQGQCTQDLAPLVDGAGVDALVLSPQGKVDALVRVIRRADQDYVLDVEGGFGAHLRERLERFLLRMKVEIEPLPWRCLALRGPESARLADTGPRVADELRVPVDWGGVTGVDLLGPAPTSPPEALRCSRAAWEAVRIEAGIPVMGAELDDRTIPAEAGLVQRCVSFGKGCYTGQELVARLDARGSNVARRLCGLVVADAPGPPEALVGAALLAEGAPAGVVTSAAWSPGLGATVALAYVHRRVPVGTAVGLSAGAPLSAEVRQLPLR